VTLPERHAFLLLTGFPLLALAGAREALHAANEVLGRPVYATTLLSPDGEACVAACGTRVGVDGAAAQAPTLAGLHVLHRPALPDGAADRHTAVAHALLRRQAQAGAVLGGLGSGCAVLAEAGVLDGHRATLGHALVPQLAQQHPAVVLSSHVYEIDGDRLTCSDGAASLDLMIAWLGRRHGERLVQALLTHFGMDRLRAADERQRAPVVARLGASNAKLAEAVALMEANLGEPLPTEDIARLVGVSRRQLERLFKQHLDELPSRYYAELRLQRARRLLQQTPQSILQIALACGFASGSHFSNAYRARFGRTPRDERSARAAAWRDAAEAAPAPLPPGDLR
jgi:transcriptional regulator GlxA family with amidase domain